MGFEPSLPSPDAPSSVMAFGHATFPLQGGRFGGYGFPTAPMAPLHFVGRDDPGAPNHAARLPLIRHLLRKCHHGLRKKSFLLTVHRTVRPPGEGFGAAALRPYPRHPERQRRIRNPRPFSGRPGTGETVKDHFFFPAGKRNGFWNPKKKGLPWGSGGSK